MEDPKSQANYQPWQATCKTKSVTSDESLVVIMQHSPFRLLRLFETDGSIICRHYVANAPTRAILWLGGVGGGFDSPAHDLFDAMATDQLRGNVASLRIRYRVSNDLDRCVEDALVALEFLRQRGIERCATIGHSLGGAVAIQAGAADPLVVAVAALASQSYGTGAVDRISPRPLLLVHGERDTVLPHECSDYVYQRALEPKQLILMPGAGHGFDEVASELRGTLESWLGRFLIDSAAPSAT